MANLEERTIEDTTMELAHKTKIIQFLGRTTPIVLQNDNGPCPLLAICNVLLLKNDLNLSSDVAEVSQEKLLSLVAERLIDSNSNVDDKDAGFVENQQQNIADAIDLLPRLATGIDVNIKFTRIDDFEFTPECAIFDLLDIPLYHGWIVDPQDSDTATAIGLKSYNTLMGELVALETRNMECDQKKIMEEDTVDFVAATTAALGVPSPSLSRGMSFEESPKKTCKSFEDSPNKSCTSFEESPKETCTSFEESPKKICTSFEESPKETCGEDIEKKAYMDEEAELLKARELSDTNQPILVYDIPSPTGNGQTEPGPIAKQQLDGCNKGEIEKSDEQITLEVTPKEAVNLETKQENDLGQSCLQVCNENANPSVIVETRSSINVFVSDENAMFESSEQNLTFSCDNGSLNSTRGVEVVKPPTFASDVHTPEPMHDCVAAASSAKISADSDSFRERKQDEDATEVNGSSVNDSEPIYEGEECILESEARISEDREPLYEGEVVLAKQGDIRAENSSETSSSDQFSRGQGELIRNFLKNSASQLTFNGLFCLQDGLKERELCVFFRNNHFNTMFKFEGELYILATDQGYLNQPDLVWEKLNEVNGDTVFMTGNFKEFNVENHDGSSWNESNAVASTTDFIASIDTGANSGLSFNSDLQLAIALQQQEFEHQQPQRNVQQQQQQQQQRQPPPVTTSSRLHVGPQVPRQSGNNSAVSSRQEAKSTKDKCKIM